MKILGAVMKSPAEQLACDEAMLDACENGVPGTEPGLIRFYESDVPFVVVGYGNSISTEVNIDACRAEGVPILRRSSGGGTVVLGPGCLAYAISLRPDPQKDPELVGVTGTNRYVMERNRRALESVIGRPVEVCGFTDLAVDGMKFSGNAQRRRRSAFLFHGTFLLSMNLGQVSRWLRRPSWEPTYRQGRDHENFVVNLGVTAEDVRNALCGAWGAAEYWAGDGEIQSAVETLVRERYAKADWNQRREFT